MLPAAAVRTVRPAAAAAAAGTRLARRAASSSSHRPLQRPNHLSTTTAAGAVGPSMNLSVGGAARRRGAEPRRFASSSDGGVTVTQTPASGGAQQQGGGCGGGDGGGGGCGSARPEQDGSSERQGPNLQTKTPAQQAEERILELQTHVRTHHRHGAYHEALQTSQSLLRACLDHFGPDAAHPATASAYNNLGLMHKMLGEFDDSRTNYTKALDMYGTIVGTDHSSYAAALNNLGNLDRAQSTMDEGLDLAERLKLNESAVRYFDEALKVRLAELGEDHPQTVTSRTNLGGTLAALVLQRHAAAARAAAEGKEKEKDGGDGGGEDDETADATGTTSTDAEGGRGWKAAEDHLRAALRTAVSNPRGRRVPSSSPASQSPTPPSHSAAAASASASQHPSGDKPKDGGRPKPSRKERIKENMLRRKEEAAQRQQQYQQQRQRGQQHQQRTSDSGTADAVPTIQTLSAASAAQNLAVFLKSRADVLAAVPIESSGNAIDRDDMYAESRRLYESALRVRRTLRGGENHPDVVATKFSLAELLATIGDQEGADRLRTEILDAYDVTEKDAEEAVEEKA